MPAMVATMPSNRSSRGRSGQSARVCGGCRARRDSFACLAWQDRRLAADLEPGNGAVNDLGPGGHTACDLDPAVECALTEGDRSLPEPAALNRPGCSLVSANC